MVCWVASEIIAAVFRCRRTQTITGKPLSQTEFFVMSKSISALKYCAAVVVAVLMASVSLAQCSTCGDSASFAYPGSACATCSGGTQNYVGRGGHAHGEVLKARIAHAQAIDARVYARNEAWPKPFACASRNLYGSYWHSMTRSGFADQNTLTGIHFGEDGKLTKYGTHQVAGILRNMPQEYKVVYIQRDKDQETSMQRLNEVQQLVSTWYGQSGRVAFSDRNPIGQNGLRAENIFNGYHAAMSPPVIPVAAGNSTVASSVGN